MPLARPDAECRICREPELDGDPLVTPCLCRGSVAHVHKSCIVRWRTTGYSILRRCEMCAKTFGPAAAVPAKPDPRPEAQSARAARPAPERELSARERFAVGILLLSCGAAAAFHLFRAALALLLGGTPSDGLAVACVLLAAHATGSAFFGGQFLKLARSSGGSSTPAEPLAKQLRSAAAHIRANPVDLSAMALYALVGPYLYLVLGVANPAAEMMLRRAERAWGMLRDARAAAWPGERVAGQDTL
ncbi:hypothetical protein DFJ74DRAFT_287775 [Hyaloraphidium curvatum]|nr:hypothetical protein DFJ74DRAFT_287775 [Hyaloraphidium curvatum]